ncbi:hypothetical protein ACQ4PT_025377 [Festuca glaucescens]
MWLCRHFVLVAALEALDITVLQLVYGDVVARRGSTSVGTCRRVPIEVEPDSYNSGDDEERLYSDVVRNLRRTSQAKNQDEADNDVHLVDDEVGEEEDLAAVEWDRENPQMEEGSIFASMSECRNALVAYYIKAERTFEVDKGDQVRYRVHCPTENCPWRMLASEMRNSTNVQHTCEESTLRKETISRAKSSWVAEEVKRWVTENHQVGAKELQKNIKDKFKIELPYMRVFNGKQQAMDSIYVDPAFGESFDENVDTNEDPNEEENVDPNEEENDDHNEEAPNDDPNEDDPDDDHNEEAPNDDPNEAPIDGGQPSVVASSASFVVVSKNKVKAPTTKRRREEAMSTRSKVDARSTRITRSKVDATSTRITRSKVDARSTRIKTKPRRFLEL